MLPTYSEATSHDHWNIIAPYISSDDLCSAALVCSRWHEIFAPHLWGNPASHFGVGNDAVYVALTRFKRTLPLARFYVRQMTHTLHLPPAHAELYEGPHADWLLTVLRRLPNLQCLVVDRLPFFDHAALLYTRRAVTTVGGSSIGPAEFPLRLLNASGCMNSTHVGLTETLLHLTSVVYLNLSHTPSARHLTVLHMLSNLPALRVLKMRGIGLTDDDVNVIGEQTGLHLRSLDVRDNSLTDRSSELLLERCFRFATPVPATVGVSPRQIGWNVSTSTNGEALSAYKGVDLNSIIRTRLASGLPDGLAIETNPMTGITHLFISGNRLTARGVGALMKTSRIQVLDVGQLVGDLPPDYATVEQQVPAKADDLLASGALLPLLAKHCASNMSYLRIHHSIVTGDINWDCQSPDLVELQGDLRLNAPAQAQERDSVSWSGPSELEAPMPVELPGSIAQPNLDPTSPPSGISELPGDVPSPTFARAVASLGVNKWATGDGKLEKEANSTPKIIVDGDNVSERSNLVSPMSPSPWPSPSPSPKLLQSPSPSLVPEQGSSSRPRSYSFLVQKRVDFVKGQKSRSPFLTPAQLPRLDILVLTDVPEKSPSPIIGERLISLVRCCASMMALAKQEAQYSYQHPPGSSKKAFERDYVRSVIALERIVIELAEPEGQAKNKAPWRRPTGKSSTEDADSDLFWSAAEGDFTFFNEEECGLPLERQRNLHFMAQKMPVGGEEQLRPAQGRRQSDNRVQAAYDVVAQIAAFRRDRQQAYERAVQSGIHDPIVEGHWEGDIQIVRPHLRES